MKHVGLLRGSAAKGSLAATTALAAILSATPATATCTTKPGPFTFHINVAMRMRSFPWLRFNLQGQGRYVPGKYYRVHFTKLPWFVPPQKHEADLSMLDPAMWPANFLYQRTGEENGNTLFDLRYIEDPAIMTAVVGLGPLQCAREVDATYNDGTRIDMNVSFGAVQGFTLPTSLIASIKVPHASFLAHAQFTNYSFGQLGGAAATTRKLANRH